MTSVHLEPCVGSCNQCSRSIQEGDSAFKFKGDLYCNDECIVEYVYANSEYTIFTKEA